MGNNTRRSRASEKAKQSHQSQNDKDHQSKGASGLDKEGKIAQQPVEGEDLFLLAKSPEKFTVDRTQRASLDSKSFASPVSRRTPGSLLGSPFNFKWESPLHLLSPSPAAAPPLFQPSPCRIPASPLQQFTVNYNGLSSPQGTPGGFQNDISDILRPFDTPGGNKLSLTELFPISSPQGFHRNDDRRDMQYSDFIWDEEMLKHQAADPVRQLAGVMKGSENDDVSAPFIGSFLVSPSTKDAFASISRRTDRCSEHGSGPKRQLEFNHLQEVSNPTNLAVSTPLPFPMNNASSRLSRVSKPSEHQASPQEDNSDPLAARDRLDEAPDSHEHNSRGMRFTHSSRHEQGEDALLDYGARNDQEFISHQPLHTSYFEPQHPMSLHTVHSEADTPRSAVHGQMHRQGDPVGEDARYSAPMIDQTSSHTDFGTISTSTWLPTKALNGITLPQPIPTTAREKALELLRKISSGPSSSAALKTEEESPVQRGMVYTPFGPAGASGPLKSLPRINTNHSEPSLSGGSPQASQHLLQQARQSQEPMSAQQQRVVYRQPPSEQESVTPRRLERRMSVASAGESHLAASVSIVPPTTPDDAVHPDNYQPVKSCHCKKSLCLKLYCDCFAAGMYCTNCSCSNCQNTKEFEHVVIEKRNQIKQRNPEAFRHKIQQDDSSNRVRHNKGCNCRKSHCLKKYCECFQNQVQCGELCKCIDCHNCDASYALQSRQRLGNRKVSLAEANTTWNVSDTPATPKYAARYNEDSAVSTPPHKQFQDLRTIVLQSGSRTNISIPGTPVTSVHTLNHPGTPATSGRSGSPAGTPTHLSRVPVIVHQGQTSYQVPVNHSGNVSVSVIQLKQNSASSPAQTQAHRAQLVTANQVVANAPLPPSSSRPPLSQALRVSTSTSLPLSATYSLQDNGPSMSRDAAEYDTERTSGSRGQEAPSVRRGSRDYDIKVEPRSPTCRSLEGPDSMTSSQQQASHPQSYQAKAMHPASGQQMVSTSMPMSNTPIHHRQQQRQQQQVKVMRAADASGQDGEEGQVGVVILMQDKDTGEQYQYYVPTNSSQVTQVVQQDGSIVLVQQDTPSTPVTSTRHAMEQSNPQSNQQSSPQSNSQSNQQAHLESAANGMQLLKLPGGQVLQIEGLQEGQQLMVQDAAHPDGVPQITVVQQPGGNGSSIKPQRPPPVGTRQQQQQQVVVVQHGGSSRGLVSMEVDGPMHRSEGSGSQDENEVPLSDLPPANPATDSPHRALGVSPESHQHISPSHHPHLPPSSLPLQETQCDRPRATPTKRKASSSSPTGYIEIPGKLSISPALGPARHLLLSRPSSHPDQHPDHHHASSPMGSVHPFKLSPPLENSSHPEHSAQSTHRHHCDPPTSSAACVEGGILHLQHLNRGMQGGQGFHGMQGMLKVPNDVIKEVHGFSRGGSTRDGMGALKHAVINMPSLGHHGSAIVTPTKLTLGTSSGMSKFGGGIPNVGSPPSGSLRPSGQLFRIAPGSTTIKPSPNSDKRYKAS